MQNIIMLGKQIFIVPAELANMMRSLRNRDGLPVSDSLLAQGTREGYDTALDRVTDILISIIVANNPGFDATGFRLASMFDSETANDIKAVPVLPSMALSKLAERRPGQASPDASQAQQAQAIHTCTKCGQPVNVLDAGHVCKPA